jgi:hypothetical protein
MPITTTASATAIIQFIGLFVFSTEWSPINHLQAIAPRISHAEHAHTEKAVRRMAIDQPVGSGAVEPHVAIIAFPACSYVSSDGWAPMALETAPGFLYVRLDGERVTFTDSKAVVETAEKQAPRSKETLKLPHLTNCFTRMDALKPGYAPPASPSAAIGSNTTAVFDFPPGSGDARACKGRTNEAGTMSRIDTVITKNIEGDLIISAENMNKRIRVKGDTHVLVANIATSFIDGSAPESASAHHFEVYFAMGLSNSGPPQYASQDLAGFGCAQNAEVEDSCVVSAIRQAGRVESPVAAKSSVPPIVLIVDYECSNTQWP